MDSPSIDPPKTLIVDDEAATLEFCSGVFTTAGHKVRSCETAHEAKLLMEEGHFDNLLLDIHLKNSSGIDLCREIKNPGSPHFRPSIWIIGFTADHKHETIMEMLMAGANDYLLKPATPEQLWVKATVALFAQPKMWGLHKRNTLLEKEIERMAKGSGKK
jgi:DNA-binding response OmpR family regulator